MNCLLKALDNTFVGTLLAGTILALFGLWLYRKQKVLDMDYEDIRKVREAASLLFAHLEIANKNYEAQLNIHSGKNSQLQNIYDHINNKFGNYLNNDFNKQFNSMTTKITTLSDDLVAKLKIYKAVHNSDDLQIIIDKIPVLNMYLLGTAVFHLSNLEQIEQYREGFIEAYRPIINALQKIIDTKQ